MRQGEIWLVNLDPAVGSEIKKTSPAIIVSDDGLGKLPLKIIVPLTDWKERYQDAIWMVKVVPDTINNLAKDSSADCFQIRSVAEERLVKLLGFVSDDIMNKIRSAIMSALSIGL